MDITDEIYFELCIHHGSQEMEDLVECSPKGLYLVEIDAQSFSKYEPVLTIDGKNYILTEDIYLWFVDPKSKFGRFDITSWTLRDDDKGRLNGHRLLADKVLIEEGDRITFFKDGEKITHEEAVGYY